MDTEQIASLTDIEQLRNQVITVSSDTVEQATKKVEQATKKIAELYAQAGLGKIIEVWHCLDSDGMIKAVANTYPEIIEYAAKHPLVSDPCMIPFPEKAFVDWVEGYGYKVTKT